MLPRPDWQNYFLGMAKYVASRATCPTRQVGSVIVDPETHIVVAMGYNGSPRGTEHCGEGCANRQQGSNTKVCKAIHAESNAILNAAFAGVQTRGKVIYITISPCLSCARQIIQAGITEVICAAKGPYDNAITLLKEAGVGMKIVTGISYPKVRIRLETG